MDVFLGEWLNLLLRWAHMIVGIGWIGTSFYFMALDYGLDTKERKSEGVYGTAWQVHGGGFYHVEKFTVAPPQTAGAPALVQVGRVSHLGDRLRAADRAVLPARQVLPDRSRGDAARRRGRRSRSRSCSLLAGWVIYEALCRSPIGQNTTCCSALCVFALILAASVLYTKVYSGARRVPACRRLRRHHHGVQRVHGHHPEPAQDGGAARCAARRRTRATGRSASSARPTTTT